MPQTKSYLIMKHVRFNNKHPKAKEGTPIFVSKEHFSNSMWIGGKGMRGAVFEQGIIHLIPSGWIRGIPGQSGSALKIMLHECQFLTKGTGSVGGFQNGQNRTEAPWKIHPGEVAVGSKKGQAARDS